MKIAIAGYGTEGKANYEYFSQLPDVDEAVIFDERSSIAGPAGAKIVLGDDAFSQIPDDFVIVRTAGLSPHKLPHGRKITSSTIEFFAKCPALIVGVTGSKGKGTTASFIAEILRATGKTVHLIGNIGVPALSQLSQINAYDIVVYELSSFQLWDAKKSPQIAIITNIEPDHLDVHENMADYVLAKANITKFQTESDLLIYNDDDQLVGEIAAESDASKLPFSNKKFAHIEDERFYFDDTEICEINAVKLPGVHNLQNALAAIDATWDLVGGDVDAIRNGLAKFDGLPHRLKFAREINSVKFYDDSIATTPGSAIAALRSFDAPKILIVGGHDKGADYVELSQEIAKSNVRMVFAIGGNRAKVSQQIRANSDAVVHEIDSQNMAEIVREIHAQTLPGDVVILSPAAASFDMFRSYVDRGEQFVDAVNALR